MGDKPLQTAIKRGKSSKLDRPPWQRLALSLLGIFVIVGIWQWATWHLYALPDTSITAFTSITVNAFYVISAIVVFMVTGKLIYDWKNSSIVSVAEQTMRLTENRQESIEEKVTEDRNIHETVEVIVKEAGVNAPEIKPFGELAAGDEEQGEHYDFER